jgi:hypothetical protein
MAELQNGRLVTDGEGRLYIQPTDKKGAALQGIHDDDGILLSNLVEVRWDEDAGGYVAVTDGVSHNETHSTNVLEPMTGTSGTLYDENGNLVYEGDPHHEGPLEGDPHAGGLIEDPDEIAPVATSHTEAYSK